MADDERVGPTFEGKVWKFGDDINTDLVIPGFALFMDKQGQMDACMSANRPGWSSEVQPGDVIVAGRNFGVGSARAIGQVFKWLGIVGVVAESFNGLGMRNCINVGLPVLPCEGIMDAFDEGDVARVDWTVGAIENTTKGTSIEGVALPQVLQDIISEGGVETMLRAKGFLAANP
jgi:3-isopropylmalate/(R)-2-methylmalate dehydratase small subunit